MQVMAREKNCLSWTIAANLEIFQMPLLTAHQLAQAPLTTELLVC